ncbi:MAG: hypothetical protein K6F01_01440 [Selenomonas sp.]|uniref:hypothetical protein n=1 Tax=Selenomonas sp. TaxID=2053611 RepID=UPI0025D4374C|nr:hypothetical protein [Selenomonas sp.]MCR5438111.1 hypothetical protein [Selenomonas sp.]
MEYCDFLFAPTFMVGDRFQSLLQWLAPEMEFSNVTLLPVTEQADAKPLHYWVPFLPPDSSGLRVRCQRQRDKVSWLFSLEIDHRPNEHGRAVLTAEGEIPVLKCFMERETDGGLP